MTGRRGNEELLFNRYAAKSLQSCSTLCHPIDSSPPGSPVPGIFQAKDWSGVPSPSPSTGIVVLITSRAPSEGPGGDPQPELVAGTGLSLGHAGPCPGLLRCAQSSGGRASELLPSPQCPWCCLLRMRNTRGVWDGGVSVHLAPSLFVPAPAGQWVSVSWAWLTHPSPCLGIH